MCACMCVCVCVHVCVCVCVCACMHAMILHNLISLIIDLLCIFDRVGWSIMYNFFFYNQCCMLCACVIGSMCVCVCVWVCASIWCVFFY